jgi:hypothetical protein
MLDLRLTQSDVGKLPNKWMAAKTGKGEGSVWKVVADDSAPSKSGFALAQTAAGPSALFNLCVADGATFKDVEIQVSFKAIRGDIDQGGGVVWRYQDADNYCVARYNPLEGNFRVYTVIAGKRKQLATAENLKEASGAWHTIRVTHHENGEIKCYLNDKNHLTVREDKTIDKPGRVGLWTKADAQTHFDGFRASGK